MDITRDEIIDYINTLDVSQILRGRFRALVLDKFPTVYQFLKSSETELKRLHGYGKGLQDLVTKVKDEFYRREKEAKDRVEYDSRVVAYKEKLLNDYNAMIEQLNPVVTFAELQGIVSMMQLMSLDEIDLRVIRQFLDAIESRRNPCGKGDGHAA